MANKLTSKEAKSILKISDCTLMHLRVSGVLRAEKKGQRFMYLKKDIENHKKTKDKKN